MTQKLPPPFSPDWAFVVQLRPGSALTPEGMQGRIEHVVSGEATAFTSLDALRAFMDQVLAHAASVTPMDTVTASARQVDRGVRGPFRSAQVSSGTEVTTSDRQTNLKEETP